MIGPLGMLGAAATLGQHCPQMAQRHCKNWPPSMKKSKSGRKDTLEVERESLCLKTTL